MQFSVSDFFGEMLGKYFFLPMVGRACISWTTVIENIEV
jgi:hypothetical protein